VEICQPDTKDVILKSEGWYGNNPNIPERQVTELWVHVGDNKFLLGKDDNKVDWIVGLRFECIKTEDQNTCDELKHLGNHPMQVNDKQKPKVLLCCHWG